MSKNRLLLAQLLKTWAQEHDFNYQIEDFDNSDLGVLNTGKHLSWIVQSGSTGIDLVSLLDKLDRFMDRQAKGPDGMFCRDCQSFYQFAEPNQDDGTLLCWSCKNNPYH